MKFGNLIDAFQPAKGPPPDRLGAFCGGVCPGLGQCLPLLHCFPRLRARWRQARLTFWVW